VQRKVHNSSLASQLVSIVEESTSQPEQNIQHMGRRVTTVGKLHIICLQGKVNAKQISVVKESQFEESESEDELFRWEQSNIIVKDSSLSH